MKRFLQKYIYLLAITCIFLAFILYGWLKLDIEPFYFNLSTSHGSQKISAYQTESGEFYVFLPSFAEMEDISIKITDGCTVLLDGIRLTDSMSCRDFSLEKDYRLSIDGESSRYLRFVRSANVATLYIQTASADMEYIHEDKKNEESASVQLYLSDGNLHFQDEGCTIKGRGNATWQMDKRPYQLTLSKEANLLDMGTASKWILLSNAMDESNLHNKLVYDLAARTGIGWTPECEYADVYLNGDYNGLYLLAEKVEAGPERLEINTESGDFLCKIDLDDRWDSLKNPFRTALGRTAEITAPGIFAPGDTERITGLVAEMEAVITSGEDLKNVSGFDMDSWIRKYLLDEISGNIDSDVASSYFYYKDGVFYAGPIWDYDMTFGIHHRSEFADSFIAKNLIKSSEQYSPYYAALYENESFHDALVEIYCNDFLPVLEQMIGGEISGLAEHISEASHLNSLRWAEMFQSQYAPLSLKPSSAETVIDYLEQKVGFLNCAWIDGIEFCTVYYELAEGRSYGSVSVQYGQTLNIPYMDSYKNKWYVHKSGERFDPMQPITEDLLLLLGSPVQEGAENIIGQ